MFKNQHHYMPQRPLTPGDVAHIFSDEDTKLLVQAATETNPVDRIKSIDEIILMLRLKYPQLFIPLAADGYPLERKHRGLDTRKRTYVFSHPVGT